jgi:curved DNA-binding protein CbpA
MLLIFTAYRVLGINKDASSAEIKKSYHKLALQHHPDKQNNGSSSDADRARAQSHFAKIAGAYEILSDKDNRQEYDALQAEQQKHGSGRSRGYDSSKFHVDFHDPYEVFKRSFQQQWGMAYPGSKYDYSEEPIPANQQLLTNGDEKKLLTSGNKDAKNGSTAKTAKKNKSNSKNDSTNNNKSALPRVGGNANRNDPNPGNGVLVVSDGRHDPANQQLVAARDPHDNRPTAINTTTKQIKHHDGTVETITETTITRPDGSTESVSMTDKADKRKDWKQPNRSNNLLTNGEDSNPRRQITDGKPKPKQPFLRLTNHAHNESNSNTSGRTSPKKATTEKVVLRNANGNSSNRSTTSSSKTKEAKPEQAPKPKRAGIFGRRK